MCAAPSATEDSLTTHRRRAARIVAGVVVLLLAGPIAAIVVAGLATSEPTIARGELEETRYLRPTGVPSAQLTDVTEDWGFAGVRHRRPTDAMQGGAAMSDVDGDGDVDVVVAAGGLTLYRQHEGRFEPVELPGVTDASGVTLADVDKDGFVDALISRHGGPALVWWGPSWIEPAGGEDPLELDGGSESMALIAADLSGHDRLDLLQVRRGKPDLVWVAAGDDPRRFSAVPLPNSDRLSLAAELSDVDLDGLLDIWVTRDIGWDAGPDAVYSRRGNPRGDWVDIADEIGTALAIDGMSISVADLNSDLILDAYVSDLGDNEVLLGSQSGAFTAARDTGSARIRPPGAPLDVISSSWATAATDINLDGITDLVVVNGGFPFGIVRNKVQGADVVMADPPAILLGIGNGRYVDSWPELGFDWDLIGRGLSVGDLDGDLDDDIVIVTLDGAVRVLRNDSTADSIAVQLAQGCPEAGTVITVRGPTTSIQQLAAAHTFLGAHGAGVIAGTNGTAVTVEVRWPSGNTTLLMPDATPNRATTVASCAA